MRMATSCVRLNILMDACASLLFHGQRQTDMHLVVVASTGALLKPRLTESKRINMRTMMNSRYIRFLIGSSILRSVQLSVSGMIPLRKYFLQSTELCVSINGKSKTHISDWGVSLDIRIDHKSVELQLIELY